MLTRLVDAKYRRRWKSNFLKTNLSARNKIWKRKSLLNNQVRLSTVLYYVGKLNGFCESLKRMRRMQRGENHAEVEEERT